MKKIIKTFISCADKVTVNMVVTEAANKLKKNMSNHNLHRLVDIAAYKIRRSEGSAVEVEIHEVLDYKHKKYINNTYFKVYDENRIKSFTYTNVEELIIAIIANEELWFIHYFENIL